MVRVAVTGCAGSVGRRVVALLADAGVDVVGVDRAPTAAPAASFHQLDLQQAALEPVLGDADVVVHLAWRQPRPDDELATVAADVEVTRRVLAAATRAGHVVLLSSATAYGAAPVNPVPLTEEAPLRPPPGFPYAVAKAEAERLVTLWREAGPGRSATILRPALVLDPDRETWLAQVLAGAARVRPSDATPPRQFTDPADVATAVVTAVDQRLDGVFNVAPDGWIAGDAAHQLAGGAVTVPAPEPAVRRLRAWSSRLGLTRTPAALVAYTLQPWVIANDRLRATGWQPSRTSEEVLVEARPGSRWRELSPQRRQEVALGLAGAVVAAAGAAAVLLVRRRSRAVSPGSGRR